MALRPCADAEDPMECLHGILMHNDEKVGEDHKAEDQYLRFKSELETGKKDIGVKNAEEMFHGDLMHGGDGNYNHQGELLPKEAPKDIGPEDLGQYMHGVLMHGDTEPGKDHSHDHKKKLEEAKPKGKILPPDSEQMMHGVLMHGDENANLNHDHEGKKEEKTKDKSSQ
ncbi:hypothetical protein KUTeg_012174 [Tegillarca granosa]|uniref:Uncharacterized protein n=1 Tax=Tegillarca granosa TaxID=220873 RepID=A0ABQ9EYS0_TEGGR|nr:hypothetical protein KUTeg_012174 [Tegillarca granosa]